MQSAGKQKYYGHTSLLQFQIALIPSQVWNRNTASVFISTRHCTNIDLQCILQIPYEEEIDASPSWRPSRMFAK